MKSKKINMIVAEIRVGTWAQSEHNPPVRFFIFYNMSYFCYWNFVLGNKDDLFLLVERKLRSQKCRILLYV